MGSKFVTVHVCDQAEVLALLAAGDRAWTATLDIDDAHRAALEDLSRRAAQRDVEAFSDEDAPIWIEAFERACARASALSVTLEVYDDPDETKELWRFIWSEWSPPDVLELPLSEAGSPHVTYLDANDVAEHRRAFARLVEQGGTHERFFPRSECLRLLSTLDEALGRGCGVFVFYAE